MKESTTDQIKGKVHEVKGAVKEKIGKVTNDPDLEAEGQDENVGGKIQKKLDRSRRPAAFRAKKASCVGCLPDREPWKEAPYAGSNMDRSSCADLRDRVSADKIAARR